MLLALQNISGKCQPLEKVCKSLFFEAIHSWAGSDYVSLSWTKALWFNSQAEGQVLWGGLFSSVQLLSRSNSLRPHGLQHARPPCPSPTPGACPNSCPESQWCHPTISCSVVPFSSHLQPFPASGSFPMSQFFESGGQIIGVTASALVCPMNTQDWSPLGWTGWISLQSKGLSRVFSNTTVQKHQFFNTASFVIQLSHPYMTIGKTIALTRQTFVGKVMSLLFNMLPRLVITFLPRSKRLLISWLQSPSAVILEPPKIKSATVSTVSPIYLSWSDGTRCHDLSFLNVEL